MVREPVLPAAPGARRRILDAAVLLFNRNGVVAVTAEDIRVAAGVSIGSLYHHFPAGKPAIVAASFDQWLLHYQDEARAVLRESTGYEAGVRAVVTHFVGWVQQHPAEARMLMRFEVDLPDPVLESTGIAARNFAGDVAEWLFQYGDRKGHAVSLAAFWALWIGPVKEYARGWLAGRVAEPSTETVQVLAEAAWLSLQRFRVNTEKDQGAQ